MRTMRMNVNLVLSMALIVSALFVSYALIAQADSAEDIVFPIAELGNCENEGECKTYCDEPKNLDACLDFAEEHNLIPEDELEQARNFAEAGGVGPGGCASKDACEAYCEDIENMDECLAFAEENDLMSPEELEEALKVQAALAKGATLPGGCRNKDECEDYCGAGDPSHMEECIEFAEAAGFIPEDELKEAKMMLEAIRNGATPPPCRGREECDEYCAEPDNFEQCITFAEAAGFVSPEEAEMARKTGGVGPGGCRGRECEDFCDKEENMPVCIDFAVENGLMDPEEAEMVKKTGGKGPGDCKGREECESFCEDPANQEVCFNFAKEHGLISEEDLRNMEEGRQQMMEAFSNAPPEVMECLNAALGAEKVARLIAGTAMPSREIGDVMQQCFSSMMGGPEGMQGGFGGPGGCRSPQECMAYCQEHPEECEGFGPPPSGGFENDRQGEGFGPPEGFEPPEGFQPPEGMIPLGVMPLLEALSEPITGDHQPPAMSPEEAQKLQEQYKQQYEQQLDQQSQQQFQQQYQQQFEQQQQQEFQRQYEQQYQQQMQQFQQPSNGSIIPPSDGSFAPPPSGDSYSPPPGGSFPPPSSAAPKSSLLGNLLQLLLNLFR